jgi:hypothetical protein
MKRQFKKEEMRKELLEIKNFMEANGLLNCGTDSLYTCLQSGMKKKIEI